MGAQTLVRAGGAVSVIVTDETRTPRLSAVTDSDAVYGATVHVDGALNPHPECRMLDIHRLGDAHHVCVREHKLVQAHPSPVSCREPYTANARAARE
jgi:hypothetical protein